MRLLNFILLLVLSINVSWGYTYDANQNTSNYKIIYFELQNQQYDGTSNLCYRCINSSNENLKEKTQDGSFFAFEVGLVAAKGGLPKHSKHSLNQKINRKVKTSDELDAIRNPLDKRPVKYDSQGRPSQRSIGEKAEVAVNPDTNTIVSVNPTSSKKAARLKRRNQRNQ